MINAEEFWTYDRLKEFIYSSNWEKAKRSNAQDIVDAVKLIERVKFEDRDKIKYVIRESFSWDDSGTDNGTRFYILHYNNIMVDGKTYSFDIRGAYQQAVKFMDKDLDEVWYITDIVITEEESGK